MNGRIGGPINGGDVVLKSEAHVVGDIHHQSLTIEKGAHFVGGAAQAQAGNARETQRASEGTLRKVDVASG